MMVLPYEYRQFGYKNEQNNMRQGTPKVVQAKGDGNLDKSDSCVNGKEDKNFVHER